MLASVSATFRKIRSRQMMGVEPLQAGIASFHATFSSVVHFEGRFLSLLTTFSAGPRHCGQFSARARVIENITTAKAANIRLLIDSLLIALLRACGSAV